MMAVTVVMMTVRIVLVHGWIFQSSRWISWLHPWCLATALPHLWQVIRKNHLCWWIFNIRDHGKIMIFPLNGCWSWRVSMTLHALEQAEVYTTGLKSFWSETQGKEPLQPMKASSDTLDLPTAILSRSKESFDKWWTLNRIHWKLARNFNKKDDIIFGRITSCTW